MKAVMVVAVSVLMLSACGKSDLRKSAKAQEKSSDIQKQ